MHGGGVLRRSWLVGVGIVMCLALSGCASLITSGGESDGEIQRLRSENADLRSENEDLQAEVRELQSEMEDLQAEVAQASAGSESAVESAEPTQEESADETSSASEDSLDTCSIAVAGSGDTSGDSVPGIMLEDFPLPSGAVLEYTNEDDHNFSLDFLLDSDLVSITAFYEEQLQAQGWEEVDRTEYEQDGLAGVETSWERGTYIPQDSPLDSDCEQTDETLTLTLQEV